LVSFSTYNFGPIAKADVAIKPLTVFIGPNNSGKSYLALAIYSMSRALAGTNMYVGPAGTRRRLTRFPIWSERRDQQDRRKLHSILRNAADDIEKLLTGEKSLREMPMGVQNWFEEALKNIATSVTTIIDHELQRCYGTDISNLGRRSQQLIGNEIEIGIKDSDSGLDWHMRGVQNHLITTEWNPQNFEIAKSFSLESTIPSAVWATEAEFLRDLIPNRFYVDLLAGIAPASHYLPASRTGILQGHKTLASLIVGQSSRAWIEPMDIPRLPGVVTDLIQALLLLSRPHKTLPRLAKVAEFLESNVTKGTIDIDVNRDEYPDIRYVNEAGQFQLHQVSSMVSEVAPMVLFLKHLIEPGHLFIIEEPESHIDGATQRNLARAIAMMVNAGVRVLVTTHSDFFLNQINNLMLVSRLSSRKRRSIGYKAIEALDSKNVAAYLFHPGTEGTQVDRLEIDSDYGIPTESFDTIHRALYDEIVKIEHTV